LVFLMRHLEVSFVLQLWRRRRMGESFVLQLWRKRSMVWRRRRRRFTL
jgi:hypothetical protein